MECRYAECGVFYSYAEWHNAEYSYAECHYAECRGTLLRAKVVQSLADKL